MPFAGGAPHDPHAACYRGGGGIGCHWLFVQFDDQAVVPAGPLSASEQACLDYGFTPGSGAYERCVSREHAARIAGRVPYGYAEARLTADARNACYSYGLEPGS